MTPPTPATLPVLRIFISSPGDVGEERAALQTLIETTLAKRPALRDKLVLRCVRFDDPQAQIPLVADLPPQEAVNAALPLPAACGIVIGLFWNRLGTPLTLDGAEHPSGTAWELENAFAAEPRPTVLLYQRTDPMTVSGITDEALEQLRQREALAAWLADFKARYGGRFIHKYSGLDAFRAMVEAHLDHEIHAWLERNGPDAPRAAPRAPYPGNPYPGLFSYTPADARIFKGRAAETEALVARLYAPHAVVPIIGASGGGKSSLMKAGVIPRLRGAGWTALDLRFHEADPVETLARKLCEAADPRADHVALAREWKARPEAVDEIAAKLDGDGRRLLLALDQFEEIRLHGDLRAPLLALLDRLRGRERVRIILTLRADFIEDVQSIPPLDQWLSYSAMHLPPPGTAFLHSVVTEPLAEAGRDIAPDLRDRLLEEAIRQPGALPLLSFALHRLVEDAKGAPLTMPETGEAENLLVWALRDEIAKVEARLSAAERALLPALFARLVDAPEDDRRTRKGVALAEMPEEVSALARKLADARLLATDGDPEGAEARVELAHEALLTDWPSLADWFERFREHLTARAELERACARWEANGRAPEFLAPDWLTIQGEAAQRDAQGVIGAQTVEFLKRSVEARKERWERQMRQLADTAALAVERWDSEAAILLCLEGLRDQIVDAASGLAKSVHEQLLRILPIGYQFAELTSERVYFASVAFSRDGARLAAGGGAGRVCIWDAGSGTEIARLEGDDVESVAFSPDGACLAAGGSDGTVWIWDTSLGKEIAQASGHGSWVTSVAFSPDGACLAIGSLDSTARIMDSGLGAEIVQLKGHGRAINSAMFSPDGARLATGSGDHTARIWDARSGAEIARLEGHEDAVCSVAFSPDGASLATGSWDGTARIWDVEARTEIARLEGHGGAVQSVAFSPDGARLATGSDDRTARIWDAESGAEIARLKGHRDRLRGVALCPNGAHLATASDDGKARIWALANGLPVPILSHPGHPGFVITYELKDPRLHRYGPRLHRVAENGALIPIPDGEMPADFIALLRALYPRRLTPEERAKYNLPPL